MDSMCIARCAHTKPSEDSSNPADALGHIGSFTELFRSALFAPEYTHNCEKSIASPYALQEFELMFSARFSWRYSPGSSRVA